MNEPKAKDSTIWIWVALAAAVIVCLGFLACMALAAASFILTSSTQVQATSTPPAAVIPDVQTSTADPAIQDHQYVGLWQFPDRWVWIKITAQGQAFQCRIAPDRTLFRSEGILTEGDQIVWEEIWGVDTIRREAGNIILDGEFGVFEYEPASDEMDAACEAPF